MNSRGNPGNPTGGSINPSEGFLYLWIGLYIV